LKEKRRLGDSREGSPELNKSNVLPGWFRGDAEGRRKGAIPTGEKMSTTKTGVFGGRQAGLAIGQRPGKQRVQKEKRQRGRRSIRGLRQRKGSLVKKKIRE